MDEGRLREQLIAQLEGGQAYTPVEKIVREFPPGLAGKRSGKIGHTGWELLEHLRIAQSDILRFTVDSEYVSPEWPAGYWPASCEPEHERAWGASVDAFLGDLAEVKRIALDPQTDLCAEITHGTGQTVLREILLVADHNAYHLGQLMQLRRALEAEVSS